MVFTWVFLTVSAVLSALSIWVLFMDEDQPTAGEKLVIRFSTGITVWDDGPSLVDRPSASAMDRREKLCTRIQANSGPCVSVDDVEARRKWFSSSGGSAFIVCHERFLVTSRELLAVPVNQDAFLRRSMTEAEFFQFFYDAEIARPSDGRSIANLGRLAIQKGYLPRALHDFLERVGEIGDERNRLFFNRLASFMQAQIPGWGDTGGKGRVDSRTQVGSDATHCSRLS